MNGAPRVGIAYNGASERILRSFGDHIDFVEMPFELLRHAPSVVSELGDKPLILHCASLSIASTVAPTRATLDAVRAAIDLTRTPWLGEHLAFIEAERGELPASPYAPGEPYNIGYTVSPVMDAEAVDRIVSRLDYYQTSLRIPILVENTPLYFVPPGSTMDYAEFVHDICERTNVGLLLDLSHFLINCNMAKREPLQALRDLPLDRVIEVHISGASVDGGTLWDDHTVVAEDIIFDMCALVMKSAPVQAVTLEYNWSINFPFDTLYAELKRTRNVVERAYPPLLS